MLKSHQVTSLTEIFHLLGDENRLRLVYACLDEPVSVRTLAEQLGISPSLVSYHLCLLRATRLMHAEKRGRQVFYSAADANVRNVLREMVGHMGKETEE